MVKLGGAYSFMWFPQTGIVSCTVTALKVKAVCSLETLVNSYRTVRHHITKVGDASFAFWLFRWRRYVCRWKWTTDPWLPNLRAHFDSFVNDESLLKVVNVVRNLPDVEFKFNLSVLGVWNLYYLVYVYRSHRCVFARHIHDIQRAHRGGGGQASRRLDISGPLLVFLVWKPNSRRLLWASLIGYIY
jgi:hypothetical protein